MSALARKGSTRAVLYARVSSKQQKEEGYSIPAQLKLLRDYAREHDIAIVKTFRDVETAKMAGRMSFNDMIEFLSSNRLVTAVLCEKTDRLYRNFRDYVTMDDLDVEIHLVKEGEVLSKSSRSHQKFIHGVKVLMAKNYVDNLSEETQKGMTTKAEQGTYPSRAPIGYRNVNIDGKGRINIEREKAEVIARMFELYVSGRHSIDSIRRIAADAGLRSHNGTVLSKSVVTRMLKNRFYIGEFSWKGNLYQGDHEPVVSRELFEQVQARFNGDGSPSRRTARCFAYTGLLKCAICGCAVTAEVKKGKYVYYHCTGARGKCGSGSVREEVLEEMLGGLVRDIVIDAETVKWIKQALRASHVDEKSYHDREITALARRYTLLQNRLDKSYEDKIDGKIDEEYWQRNSEAWRHEERQIREKIATHEVANKVYFDEGVKILELAQRAYSLWERRSSHERRRLLDILLSNCTFDSGTLYPTYRKPFCWLADGSYRSVCVPQQNSNMTGGPPPDETVVSF